MQQMARDTLARRDGRAWDCVSTDLTTVKGQSLEWTDSAQDAKTQHFAVGSNGEGVQRPAFVSTEPCRSREASRRRWRCSKSSALPAAWRRSRQIQGLDRLQKRLHRQHGDLPVVLVRIFVAVLSGRRGSMCEVAWYFSFAATSFAKLIPPRFVRLVGMYWESENARFVHHLQNPRTQSLDSFIQDPFALRELINSYIKNHRRP